jgi:hypothetical protein
MKQTNSHLSFCAYKTLKWNFLSVVQTQGLSGETVKIVKQ